MSKTSTTSVNESAYDLFDRWMAHRQQEDVATGRPDLVDHDDEVEEAVETDEEFEEFAHPAPTLGGAAGAPSLHLGPEANGGVEPLPASPPSPLTTGASMPHPRKHPTPVRRPVAAPTPGLVLFSPRRGIRHLITGLCALLAAGSGIAGCLAWQAPTPTSIGIAGGLVVALLLVWKLRTRTADTQITIDRGVLKIARGDGRHQFPLVGAHPPIDILGEPGQRSWKVLIQRRGMPPFVITRRMVDPAEFTEVIRHSRQDA